MLCAEAAMCAIVCAAQLLWLCRRPRQIRESVGASRDASSTRTSHRCTAPRLNSLRRQWRFARCMFSRAGRGVAPFDRVDRLPGQGACGDGRSAHRGAIRHGPGGRSDAGPCAGETIHEGTPWRHKGGTAVQGPVAWCRVQSVGHPSAIRRPYNDMRATAGHWGVGAGRSAARLRRPHGAAGGTRRVVRRKERRRRHVRRH